MEGDQRVTWPKDKNDSEHHPSHGPVSAELVLLHLAILATLTILMPQMHDRVMSILRHGLYTSHPGLVLGHHRPCRSIMVPQDPLVSLEVVEDQERSVRRLGYAEQ